jgi:methylenetetrahydrofolate reductase (NADPH)
MVLDARVGGSQTNRLLVDYSLEMTAKDGSALAAASELLPVGTLVNVTFLGNEDIDMRLAAARAARAADAVPVPHIAARRLADRNALDVFLGGLAADAGVNRVVVVGGDPSEPAGPFASALDVIDSGLLEAHGVQHVSIGGYPEGHPDISEPVLWRALEDKIAALAERGLGGSIITQFGFDADAVLRWIGEVRGRGIRLPIRVGVPGPAGLRRLLKYAKRFGVSTSAGIVQKYGLSLTNLVGSTGPDQFVRDLAAQLNAAEHGTVRLHFYTFGGLTATATWIRDFREES